jgi:DNA-binding FrmR family transcriptional regulator
MVHTKRDKDKLLNRVRRIRGQVNAVEQALTEDKEDCASILQTIAACRGAMNALMAELIEDQIQFHLCTDMSTPDQVEAGDQLIDIVRAYLK